MTQEELAGRIDQTLLTPDCSKASIQQICAEGIEYKFAAVCIPPYWVKTCKILLENTSCKITTVIGFPMGYSATASKVEEIKRAVDDGTDELDVVINICAVKEGKWSYVANDINTMVTAAHIKGKIIKVIIETGLMNEEEIKKLSEICLKARADFIKTSTGVNGSGATIDAIKLIKSIVGDEVKIKASGGIKTPENALSFINAGANRIGSNAGIAIITKK